MLPARPHHHHMEDRPSIIAAITVVLLSVVQLTSCASLSEQHANSDVLTDSREVLGYTIWSAGGAVVASVALVLCGVVLLMVCTDFCQKHAGFKDFDNDTFTDETLSPVPTPSEFTMYPPVESTPEVITTTPVVFEPLPDLATRVQHQEQTTSGVRCIRRPRVSQEVYERSDSIDSLDDIIRRDSMQDKVRLQNILTNSRQQVPRGQLQYIKELGNGWFGKVLQGEGHGILPGHKKTKVVIQMLKEEIDTQEQLAFLEEALAYRDTDHPNVIKLLGQCVDTAPFLNILELCPFGDLKTYLRSHRVAMESFNEKGLLLKFACDMAAGLQALHQEGFIHRDFATRTCLLASDLSVKVGDYGLSEETFKEDYYTDSSGDCLPIRWLAPECLFVSHQDVAIKKVTKESNIWSYGVCMWEILTFGSLPYGDLTNNHVLRLVVMEKSVRLPKPDVVVNNLDKLYELMRLCWGPPEHRPSLRELRIMLLHLLSRKDDTESSAFDLKWNQLMPRPSPRVTRVAEGRLSQSHGPAQANGTVHAISSNSNYNNRPRPPALVSISSSVMTSEDLDTSLPDLNASKLGLAGSLSSLEQDLSGSQASHAPQLTSPVNELSIVAEFSAANAAAAIKDTHGNHAAIATIPSADTHPSQSALLGPGESVLSPIKSDDSADIQSSHDSSMSGQTTVVSAEPRTASPHNQQPVPDIIANNSPSNSLDFVTSTPRREDAPSMPQREDGPGGDSDAEQDLFLTATGESLKEHASDSQREASGLYLTGNDASQGLYHTTTSITTNPVYSSQTSINSNPIYSSQSSMERSLSLDYEERSFMAPQKFADMLKTVAMTPSVDDEMLDSLNDTSPSLLSISEENVFGSPTQGISAATENQLISPEGRANSPVSDLFHQSTINTTEETLSGDTTPRNTPTPPLATSAAPVLDVSGGESETETESRVAASIDKTPSGTGSHGDNNGSHGDNGSHGENIGSHDENIDSRGDNNGSHSEQSHVNNHIDGDTKDRNTPSPSLETSGAPLLFTEEDCEDAIGQASDTQQKHESTSDTQQRHESTSDTQQRQESTSDTQQRDESFVSLSDSVSESD